MRCNYCFSIYGAEIDICPSCGYKNGDAAQELFYLNPGTVLGSRYTVGQVLGAGGFGIVYKAWDNHGNHLVAIKEYYPSGLVARAPGTENLRLVAKNRSAEFDAGKYRFTVERSGTMHTDMRYRDNPSLPHSVSAIDDNGTHYMVMEFLQGNTLTEHVEANGAMPVNEGLGVISAILKAVRDIHKEDIIHRDISPDNIILTPSSPKLIDFGAAKFGKRDNGENAERVMKPGYSPPEQYEPDGRAGIHTDIYSLGATLYFMLTGYKPDEATNRKTGDLLASPDSLVSDIPKHVNDAILRAMAIDHRLRFKNAIEFLDALMGQTKVRRPEKETKIRKLKRLVAIASSFLVLGIVGVFTYIQVIEQVPMLNDAEVELWFVLSGDSAEDSRREFALNQVINQFSQIYPNVIIMPRGIEEELFAIEVEIAIGQGRPVIFESDNINQTILAATVDLNSVANRVGDDSYFLDAYTRFFPNRNQIPTGFVATCVFVNTDISNYMGNTITDLTALLASMPAENSRIAVQYGRETAFISVFGNVSHVPQQEFMQRQAGALFAETSAFGDIQAVFAGTYRLVRLDMPQVPAAFGGMFSIVDSGRDELAAKRRFLEFMLSENAQDALHIQAQSGLFPINQAALKTFTEVFTEFADFFDNIDDFDF